MPTTKWSDLKKSQLDPERIEAITQKAREEILEMNLRELRQQVGLTQKQMADAIGVAQSQLSRMEHRDDHVLSTLRTYVEALGGELEIVAETHQARHLTAGLSLPRSRVRLVGFHSSSTSPGTTESLIR